MSVRSPRRQFAALLIALVVIASTIIPFSQRGWISLWSLILRGIHSTQQTISWHWNWPWNVGALTKDRDILAQRNQQLLTAVTGLQAQIEVITAAEELKSLVANIQRTSVIGTVIGYSPDPGVQSISINRGTRDGILRGQAVLSTDGVVIGKIHDVSSNSSTIMLLTDSHSSILARVNNATLSPGVIKGQQGVSLHMELVPRNDIVVVGQTVVTSGSEALIPMNLPIGTVSEISTRQGDVFQNATITASIVPFRLTAVAVIIR